MFSSDQEIKLEGRQDGVERSTSWILAALDKKYRRTVENSIWANGIEQRQEELKRTCRLSLANDQIDSFLSKILPSNLKLLLHVHSFALEFGLHVNLPQVNNNYIYTSFQQRICDFLLTCEKQHNQTVLNEKLEKFLKQFVEEFKEPFLDVLTSDFSKYVKISKPVQDAGIAF